MSWKLITPEHLFWFSLDSPLVVSCAILWPTLAFIFLLICLIYSFVFTKFGSWAHKLGMKGPWVLVYWDEPLRNEQLCALTLISVCYWICTCHLPLGLWEGTVSGLWKMVNLLIAKGGASLTTTRLRLLNSQCGEFGNLKPGIFEEKHGTSDTWQMQWNLSVMTTSIIKSITWDLFSNVFYWRLEIPIYFC